MPRFLAIILLLAASLPAQAGWQRAGLFGADVRTLVVAPHDADIVFLGTSHGEVYRSGNGAKSWTNPRGGTPFPGYAVDNLAIDGRGRLWAAAWGIWGGSVVAVSEDEGKTWQRRDEGLEKLSIRALALDASNAERLVVGGLEGVFISDDAGRSWKQVSDRVNVESLAIDPVKSDTIYMGTWRQGWRSDDGGKSWKHVAKGMVLDTDIFSILVEPSKPESVWLATCGWVYNSADRGEQWTRFKEGFNNRRIHDIRVGPVDSNVVYAGSVAGLYRSPDRGKSWEVISPENLVINSIGLHPKKPNRIILGTEGDGIYVSNDGGKSFARSSDGLHNVKVTAVVPDSEKSGVVYAAVFFGGAASGVYRSGDGGRKWERLSATPLPEILSLVVRKEGASRFIAGTERGFYYSADGVEWLRAEPALTPVRVERIIAYNDSRLFAATSEGVFTSRDAGLKWHRLNDMQAKSSAIALGRHGGKPALLALTAEGLQLFDGNRWSEVKGAPRRGRSVAVHGDAEELVVVASSDGVRAGRIDAALKWSEIDRPVAEPGAVYASAPDRMFVASRERPGLLERNGAASWNRLSLPLTSADIATVAIDPFNEARLFIATWGQGLYIWDRSPRRPSLSSGGVVGGSE